jgi:hypothetical protein
MVPAAVLLAGILTGGFVGSLADGRVAIGKV